MIKRTKEIKIIGLTGKKKHGKTTSVNFLTKRSSLNIGFINMKKAIIDEMKRECKFDLSVLSVIYLRSLDKLFETKPYLMRKLMQNFGLKKRLNDPDYWVRRWEASAMSCQPNIDLIVVDDVRYPNEEQAIKRLGGKVYRIVKLGAKDDGDQHPTETAQDAIKCDIIEARDVDELERKLYKRFHKELSML